MSLEQQMQLDETYIIQSYKRKPVEFVRGEGIRLYDDTGKEYLDFLSGIGAVSVGHSNPRVVEAIQQQAAKLLHVSNFFHVEGRGELAEKISDLLNTRIDREARTPWKTFFSNSGAEAVEGAIKLARKYGIKHLEGADTIISARRSFHGRTLAALAATGQPSKQESFEPIPQGFIHVDLNDINGLKTILNTRFAGKGICAVLLECIQGEGGVNPCTEEYIKDVRKITKEQGILLIIDEVQTGFYRTGEYPFAFQHFNIMPDVVTLAKGLGGGVPIGAFAACGLAAKVLEPGDHGTTFGGSPLVIAAANAVLDELERMDAATHVADVGRYLQERLLELPYVTEIRGKGLMVGVEFSEAIAEKALTAGLEAGLVFNSIGHRIIRFLPPLVCTKDDIDILIEGLKKILEQL